MNVVMKHSKSKKKWLSRIISGLLSMAMLTTNVTSLSTVRAEGQSVPLPEERQVEKLDRGLMAIKVRDGVYLSWRFLGTDSTDTAFHIYRDGNRITDTPITGSTNYQDASGTLESVYTVHTLLNGVETEQSKEVSVLANNYFDIPLDKPQPGVTPTGGEYDYFPNDASCADLDGDGEYEIILKWMPSNSGDNMADGYRGKVYLDAYKLDGRKLWRIDLGVNIRAGAHYTQFMVYDFDSDGYAELVCKTGDGTTDGLGNSIGDPQKDWRNGAGTIMDGPEYLTLFDGFTGEALDTIDYEPSRGPNGVVDADYWGDNFGNRSERYLGAVAYLNGKTPSVIMSRGYYKNFGMAAYDIVDKKFQKRWFFNTADPGYEKYVGQGNHNLAVADVDEDGFDEIVFGGCTIDHDGTGLYSSELGHGDAIHVGDFDLDSPGLEIFTSQEHAPYGVTLRKASNGEILFRHEAGDDTGRGIAGNFRADVPGAEYAASMGDDLWNSAGEVVGTWSSITKWSQNFTVYWDGDLEQEVLDRTMIDGYGKGRLLTAPGVSYINGTKGNPSLSADLLGDWREEVIWPTYDGNYLRVFHTTFPTEYRLATLMHDTQYRTQIASQNVGYNQPAHTSFFLGTGYDLPGQPQVEAVEAPAVKGKIAAYDFEALKDGKVPDITGNGRDLQLFGNAAVREDPAKDSSVLYLDGSDNTYAELPQGIFDGLKEATIELEIRVEDVQGSSAVFAVGQDQQKYMCLKALPEELQAAITQNAQAGEQAASGSLAADTEQWFHVSVVLQDGRLRLYKDRSLLAEQETGMSLAELGASLIGYLGKSFVAEEGYFKGAFDHVEVYNYARTDAAIAKTETVSVSYEAEEGGRIEGKVSQTMKKGTTASPVTAVAEQGWHFVRWSDGTKTASRQDGNVMEDQSFQAIFGKDVISEKSVIAAYDFESVYQGFVPDTTKNGFPIDLCDGAKIENDQLKGSQALILNGQGAYAKLPDGMFDGMEQVTIQMDVRSQMGDQNFFTFAIGQDDQKYAFLKLKNNKLYFAITKESYTAEQKVEADIAESQNEWMNLAIVLSPGSIKLYQDGTLVAENNQISIKLSEFGQNLKSFLGKSFYNGDAYFNGAFDNIKIYNYALTQEELNEQTEIETVTVQYEAKEGGKIEGNASQTIKKGSRTEAVTAIPKEGYRFIKWSDGSTEAKRTDQFVTSDQTVTAFFGKEMEQAHSLIASYKFEELYGDKIVEDASLSGNLLEVFGNAKVEKDSETGSNVLYLDGSNETYAQLPTGMFDGRKEITIRMDLKPEHVNGAYFTVAIGQNDTQYYLFTAADTELKSAITQESFSKEQIASGEVASCEGKWIHVDLVLGESGMRIYQNRQLVAENTQTTLTLADLGENLISYLGKSFYGADTYFKGAFDNIHIYNYAMTEEEVENIQEPKEEVTVTYKAGEGGEIQGATVQKIVKGTDTEKVKAVAKAGYTFEQWSDGLTTAERQDTKVEKDLMVTAEFKKMADQPNTDPKPQLVESISLDKYAKTMTVGQKFELVYQIKPQNADNQRVSIVSSNQKVATVSGTTITAKAAGTADITVKAEDGSKIQAVLKVTVRLKETSKVTVTQLSKKCQAKVKFSKIKGAKKYTIYRSLKPSSGYRKLADITKTSYTDKKVKAGKTYYYKVTARGSRSIYDSVQSKKYGKITVLAKPKVKVSSVKPGKIKVSWKKIKGASGFRIYVSASKTKGYRTAKVIQKASTKKAVVKVSKKWKKVYVKVRPFKKVKGKKVYGTYSAPVSISVRFSAKK